jgi:hypothetical protein
MADSTLRISFQVSVNGATAVESQFSASGSALLQISESVPESSTDLQINCSIDEDTLTGFFLYSDKAVTVETNSGSAPQETIALGANEFRVWKTGMGTKPISDDVTALFVTNAGSAAANVTIIALTDSTP